MHLTPAADKHGEKNHRKVVLPAVTDAITFTAMKWLAVFILLTFVTELRSQDSAYANFLDSAPEVGLTDSLRINADAAQLKLLDSGMVKKWLPRLLPSTANNRLKNRRYYLAGKITRNDNFDLLMVVEEKKRADSSNVQVIHLVTTKKDGGYIASIEAAVSGTKRRSNYDISSWLYNDYRVIKDSRITVNEKSYDDMAVFRINNAGRFILYPNQ